MEEKILIGFSVFELNIICQCLKIGLFSQSVFNCSIWFTAILEDMIKKVEEKINNEK